MKKMNGIAHANDTSLNIFGLWSFIMIVAACLFSVLFSLGPPFSFRTLGCNKIRDNVFITFQIDMGSWYVWTMILFGNVPLSLPFEIESYIRQFLRLRITFEVTPIPRQTDREKERHKLISLTVLYYNVCIRWQFLLWLDLHETMI